MLRYAPAPLRHAADTFSPYADCCHDIFAAAALIFFDAAATPPPPYFPLIFFADTALITSGWRRSFAAAAASIHDAAAPFIALMIFFHDTPLCFASRLQERAPACCHMRDSYMLFMIIAFRKGKWHGSGWFTPFSR